MAFTFNKHSLKDLLVALSFVNLCFIRVWTSLGTSENYFYQENVPSFIDLAALIANILVLSLAFFLAILLFRRTRSSTLRIILACFFFSICIIPLNFLRINLTDINFTIFSNLPKIIKITITLTSCALFFYLVKIHLSKSLKITYALLLIISPLLLLNTVNAFLKISKNNTIKPNLTLKAPTSESQVQASKQKVILMIYDALDYHNLFISKNTAGLPHLTQFKNQSMFASQALSPSNCTLNSIPSYLMGKTVVKAKAIDAHNAQVLLKGANEFSSFNGFMPNFFQKIKQQGTHISVVGWHFPYCKLFGNFIDQCTSLNSGLVSYGSNSNDFLKKISEQFQSLNPLYRRMYTVSNFLKFNHQVSTSLQNSNIDFLYIHWPLPHNPIIYDGQKDEISPLIFSNNNNLNLRLLDKTLATHLNLIKENNWKNAIIIITADHGWGIRPSDEFAWIRRIPFMIRLPNSMKYEKIDFPFNTLLLYDLVPKLINREISSNEEIKSFIQQNAGISDEENQILEITNQAIH